MPVGGSTTEYGLAVACSGYGQPRGHLEPEPTEQDPGVSWVQPRIKGVLWESGCSQSPFKLKEA